MQAVQKDFDVVLNLEKKKTFETSSEKKHTLKTDSEVSLLLELLV